MYKNRYDWEQLEKIAPPEKWLAMYADYQDMLIKEDVAGWYAEQFNIANKEREQLKDYSKLTRVEVIEGSERTYVNWKDENRVDLSFQDKNKTLKIFINPTRK